MLHFVLRLSSGYAPSIIEYPQILNLYRLSADENKILRFIIEAASCFFFFYRGWSTRTRRNVWIRSCMNEESSSHVQTYMRRRTCRSYRFRKSGRWVYLTKLTANSASVQNRKLDWNWIEASIIYIFFHFRVRNKRVKRGKEKKDSEWKEGNFYNRGRWIQSRVL